MDCCWPCNNKQKCVKNNIIISNDLYQSKMKYSFRTQDTSIVENRLNDSRINFPKMYGSQQKHFNQKGMMGSTVASQNQFFQLQKQRQQLIVESNRLDQFYHHTIIPLEREVDFYEKQVKVRSIQIMQLEQLLSQRLRQRNIIHTHQRNIISHKHNTN